MRSIVLRETILEIEFLGFVLVFDKKHRTIEVKKNGGGRELDFPQLLRHAVTDVVTDGDRLIK
jgi:hypothetical protein